MSDRHICRAIRIDNGEWVEGFYFCMVHDDGRHVHHFIMPLGADLSLGTPIEKIQAEVDPSTICQCTGLPDKNGKNIFEGDIIRYIDEIIGKEKIDEVKYNETYALFCRLHKSVMGLQHFFIDEAVANRCEVIGNIFDNPELLEGGAK